MRTSVFFFLGVDVYFHWFLGFLFVYTILLMMMRVGLCGGDDVFLGWETCC